MLSNDFLCSRWVQIEYDRPADVHMKKEKSLPQNSVIQTDIKDGRSADLFKAEYFICISTFGNDTETGHLSKSSRKS